MNFSIRRASLSDIAVISDLLHVIWRPTYGTILSEEQTRFMLSTLFSKAKMEQQILEEKHQFVLASFGKQPVGFAAYQNNFNQGHEAKLHKLYLLPEKQGMGLGSLFMQQLIQLAKSANQKGLILNVNRANPAKKFYERLGFKIVEAVDIPIGNGYFMNDFVMRLLL